jgi:hypothetical protein
VAAWRVEGTPPNATATAVTNTNVTRAAQAARMNALDFKPCRITAAPFAFWPGPSVLRLLGTLVLSNSPEARRASATSGSLRPDAWPSSRGYVP